MKLADAVASPTSRCSVLLAPPGTGKTTELRRLVSGSSTRGVLVSLNGANEARLLKRLETAIAEASANATGTAPMVILLDSVDEATVPMKVLNSLIEEAFVALPQEIRVAVACRTAAWSAAIEQTLRGLFGDVAIYDLAPLDEDNIKVYAESAGADPDAFLRAVESSRAMPLAVRINMLKFLVDEYLADPGVALSVTQTQLYQRGCRRMIEGPDPNEPRLVDVDVRHVLHAAGRLAVVSLFTGRCNFRLTGQGGGEELGAEDCVFLDHGTVIGDVDHGLYRTVLGTELFEGAGESRLRFAHQTLIEYLAASHLIEIGLPLEQVDGLLRSRGGRLAPQVQAVAAWLIAERPEEYQGLLDDDPVAFVRSSVELTDPRFRKALVERLLQLAQRSELLEFGGLPIDGLAYDGIDDRLRAVLTDSASNFYELYLAIRLVRQNTRRGMCDTMVVIARDNNQEVAVRTAAAGTVFELGTPDQIRSLEDLADPAVTPPDNHDELLAIGLKAKVRGGMPAASILEQLTEPKATNFFGGYRSFVCLELTRSFAQEHTSLDEIRVATEWVANIESISGATAPTAGLATFAESLCHAILRTAIVRCDDDNLRSAVARVIAQRLRHHRTEPIFGRREKAPILTDDLRRLILEDLHQAALRAHEIWYLRKSGLVAAEDFPWLVERASAETTDDGFGSWGLWLQQTYDVRRADHAAAIATVPVASPLYQHSIAPLLRPLQLADLDIDAVLDDPGPPPPTGPDLVARLTECLDLDPAVAFHSFCHWAQFKPDSRYGHDLSELDIRNLPGWGLVDTDTHHRVAAEAQRYLETANSNGESVLGTSQYSTGAQSAVRAMVLLHQLQSAIDLTADRWAFWTPALVNIPTEPADEELLTPLLRLAFDHAPDRLITGAAQHMRGMPDQGRFLLQRIAPALTVDSAAWLKELVNDDNLDDATAATAFERLLAIDTDDGVDLLRTALAANRPISPRATELAVAALDTAGQASWPTIHTVLTSDDASARSVIEEVADTHDFNPATLTEEQLVELWQLTYRLFPPTDDPALTTGSSWVSRHSRVSDMRDWLLPALAERGTTAAVSALQALADRDPDDIQLRQLCVRARAALARQDWTPLTPTQIQAILTNNKLVVRSDADLLNVILIALQETQQDLTGETPLATLLWNHGPTCRPDGSARCRPKTEDEISDFLQDKIRQHAPGIIVNREVQVTRLMTSGIGQRTDLLVQAQAPTDPTRTLRVVIETKGCWNDEIPHALEQQLVDRYVSKWPGSAGVFLVAWFDPAHGYRTGTWRTDPVRRNPTNLSQHLNHRAADASRTSGHEIRALTVDCSMPQTSSP